ncbi:MAG: DMT family transporter [Actinobacteria bacterium]|nr:DMT family transporter [Actinomycetota bacterium]
MSRRPTPSRLAAVGAALLVTFLWSSSWILIRWGLDDEALAPITFAALRYGLAAVVLGGWVASRPGLRAAARTIGARDALRLGLLGLVFYAVTQGAQFVAIDNQPAATTSVVLSWTPLLVAGLAGRSLSESPMGRQVAGSGLVAGGAWLYFSGDLGATAAGMAAALVALGANAGSALLGRAVNRSTTLPSPVVTAASMGVGAVILVAAGLGAEGIPTVSLRAWALIAWLAGVNTALAFTLWNWSLRRLSALESAAINNTMLLQIAALAWVFLGERPGTLEIAGMLAVSAGVFLAQAAGGARSAVPRAATRRSGRR